jgi:transposase
MKERASGVKGNWTLTLNTRRPAIMLYLGIDQHRKQLTVNVRDEQGEVILRRQVSTQWDKVKEFFSRFRQQAEAEGGYMTILEVCGFNDWLLKVLGEYACRDIVLVQMEMRSKQKTDHRDANALSELLWINRQRLLAGQHVHHLRRVRPASSEDAEARQLTSLRHHLVRQRTRTRNRVQHILLKHNLQQDCPTKSIEAKAARQWLKKLKLPEIDQLELKCLLKQWTLYDQQLERVDAQIRQRQPQHATAKLVASLPGAGADTSLAIGSRIGAIGDVRRPGSLANYWGLTPGCRDSGDKTQRLGSITKRGSRQVRFLLGQMVLRVLRADKQIRDWYREVRRRRGSKIARVAVMRRVATILWHMVKHQEAYQPGGPPRGAQGRLKVQPG